MFLTLTRAAAAPLSSPPPRPVLAEHHPKDIIPELSAHHLVDDGVEHAVGLGQHGRDQRDYWRKRGSGPGAAAHWLCCRVQRGPENIAGAGDGVVDLTPLVLRVVVDFF